MKNPSELSRVFPLGLRQNSHEITSRARSFHGNPDTSNATGKHEYIPATFKDHMVSFIHVAFSVYFNGNVTQHNHVHQLPRYICF
ncbi:MAG: hypothetical protein ACTSUE_23090 [Promethearchaeota archaeon]